MAKIKSKGSVLQLEIASVFTAITQLTGISGPTPDVEVFDATALDSAAGRETKPTGYVTGGEVSFDMFYDPVAVTHQALTDLITTPAVVNWKIIFADAAPTTWAFAGVFKGLGPSIDMGDGLKASGSIALDGMVSYPT